MIILVASILATLLSAYTTDSKAVWICTPAGAGQHSKCWQVEK